MDPKALVGKSRDHVVRWRETNYSVHKDVTAPLEALCAKALTAGFRLEIVSGFRDFPAQRNIWAAKVTGQRAILDDQGRPLDFRTLSAKKLIAAILRWSALPGLSRHHWGTDIDVYDASRLPAGYQLQLVPSEYLAGGIFADMTAWLDANLASFGFFRPYATDRGGVSPEPWHLSYAPLAEQFRKELSLEIVERELRADPIALQDEVLAALPEIFNRFFLNTDIP